MNHLWYQVVGVYVHKEVKKKDVDSICKDGHQQKTQSSLKQCCSFLFIANQVKSLSCLMVLLEGNNAVRTGAIRECNLESAIREHYYSY